MKAYVKSVMEARSEVFKALGHPTRLWIVEQLFDGEHCVCEFVEAVGDKFPTISRHLSVLKEAGVIAERRDGKRIFYSLTCPCIKDVVVCLAKKGCCS